MSGASRVCEVIQIQQPGRVAQVGEAGASRIRCKAVAKPVGCLRVVPEHIPRTKGLTGISCLDDDVLAGEGNLERDPPRLIAGFLGRN